jgi:hypothetical protein
MTGNRVRRFGEQLRDELGTPRRVGLLDSSPQSAVWRVELASGPAVVRLPDLVSPPLPNRCFPKPRMRTAPPRAATGTDVEGELADACAGWLIRGDALVEHVWVRGPMRGPEHRC